jgi:hypothetical protein
MLLWEIDRSLTELTQTYGFERASRAYRASLQAVNGLKSLVLELGLRCDMRDKDSLYLAAGSTSKELIEEHELRSRANLPGAFFDHAVLLENFGIARAGAIVSPGAADADPMQCDAENHSFDHSDGVIELGDRDRAAAGQHLERRRADLGRQQGPGR